VANQKRNQETGDSMSRIPKIGVLYGQERSFPEALVKTINERYAGRVTAEPVRVGAVPHDERPAYDLIFDRISHEVPFYRTWLKAAAARGVQVLNNPFWWSTDDKFICNIIAQAAGVMVPKTVLLPHRNHPPNTTGESFSNLVFPIEWDEVFAYLGFPIFMKPAFGGGWRDVHKVDNADEFFAAYAKTGSLSMIAQEAIVFTEYFRCYALGRSLVRVMRWDPSKPHAERYAREPEPIPAALEERLRRDCVALCEALGYDLNTVELAMRGGVPYAIDFMNPAPDCDVASVGQKNFDWVVSNAADLLAERAQNPRPFEMTGSWPALFANGGAKPLAAAGAKAARGAAAAKGAPPARDRAAKTKK